MNLGTPWESSSVVSFSIDCIRDTSLFYVLGVSGYLLEEGCNVTPRELMCIIFSIIERVNLLFDSLSYSVDFSPECLILIDIKRKKVCLQHCEE